MESQTTASYLDELYSKLSLALGDAVWSFARVEWQTYHYIGLLSEDRLDELIGDVAFRARIAILRRMIERREITEQSKERALEVLNKAEKLAEKRNIIVHNPWRVWMDFDEKEYKMELQKFINRDKKVSLEELEKFTAEVKDLQAKFKETFDAL